MPLDDERLAEIVALAIKTATAPLVARVAALEQRALVMPRDGEAGPPGPPGKDVDPSALIDLKSELATLRFDMNEFATKAFDVEARSEVAALVKAEVETAVAALPPPQDGIDGKDGASVSREDVLTMVKSAVAEIPAAKDGVSVTVEDVAPLLESLVTKAVDGLPKPKDGVGLVGAFQDRDGNLILTLSDGTTKDVGSIAGKDVDMSVVQQRIEEEVARIPRPKDGRDGTLEAAKFVRIDEDTYQWQFKDGTPVEGDPVIVAGIRYEGVWREGESYKANRAVTFGGSVFISTKDTASKPETDDSWRLAVKRGRDGKNGRDR